MREIGLVRIHGKLDEIAQSVGQGDEENICHPSAQAAYPEFPFEYSVQCPEQGGSIPALVVRSECISDRSCQCLGATTWMNGGNVGGLEWLSISSLERRQISAEGSAGIKGGRGLLTHKRPDIQLKMSRLNPFEFDSGDTGLSWTCCVSIRDTSVLSVRNDSLFRFVRLLSSGLSNEISIGSESVSL